MTRYNHVPVTLPELETKSIDRKRYYITPTGSVYPSITTVLSIRNKKGLIAWRKRVGNEVANYVAGKAAARGTKVHHMCEDYLNNQHIDWPNKWEEHSKDFLPWCLFNELSKKVLCYINDINAQECSLYSDKYKIAGRVDCIANYKERLSVIDFKTSTKERSDAWNENYYVQCSAYAEMFEELTGKNIDQIVVLVVTEDGTVQEFIKEKSQYTDLLVDAISDWREQNEKVPENISIAGVV